MSIDLPPPLHPLPSLEQKTQGVVFHSALHFSENSTSDRRSGNPNKIPTAIAPVESVAMPEFSVITAQQSSPATEASPLPHPSPAPAETPLPSDSPASTAPASATPPVGESSGESSDVFERVFGRSRNGGTQQIIVPLYIDDQIQGQLPILTATRDAPTIRVQATVLLEKLGDAIRPDILQQLTAAIDTSGNLSLDALYKGLGYLRHLTIAA